MAYWTNSPLFNMYIFLFLAWKFNNPVLNSKNYGKTWEMNDSVQIQYLDFILKEFIKKVKFNVLVLIIIESYMLGNDD